MPDFITPVSYEEQLYMAITDMVRLFAHRDNGSWEIERKPELMSVRVTYSRKLKFAPFNTYKIDRMIEYSPTITDNKNLIPKVKYTLEDMKKELNDYILNQLTE